MISKSCAARRLRRLFTRRGLPDPARLYELNSLRTLPADYPSSVPDVDTDPGTYLDTDVCADTDEEGIDPSEPIITTAAQARRMYAYVARTGVVRHIDKVLRDHPGEQPVLTTQMLLAAMLLATKLQGRYMRTVHCAVLAGLDAAVAIEWGLLDPDTGRSLLSYNMVWRQSKRLESLLEDGADTPDGTHIDLQWMVDRFLAPSIPKWVARKVIEISIDATDYPTWARTTDFTRQDEIRAGRIPDDTVLKPNGNVQHTKDKAAGIGRRSPKQSQQSEYFNGYWLHPAVATRTISRGKRLEYVPPYIVAMVLASADQHVGPIGYQVATKAKQLAPSVDVVKADQHYTAKKTTFVRPLREHGWEIVMNQAKDRQEGVKLITAGTDNTPLYVNCGTFLVEWTPKHLLRPSDGLTGTDRQKWFDERAKYAWVVIGRFPDGRKKIMCPQCAGKVKSTARTYNTNRANRRKRRSPLPVTAVADRESCCDGMITLGVDQLDNHQRNAYGTTKWATDYAGRNPVEGVNGMIKNDGSFNRASCRVFGLGAHTLAALAAAVIHNLKQTGRGSRRKNRNPTTPDHPGHTPPDTTPPAEPGPHPTSPTTTRAPP